MPVQAALATVGIAKQTAKGTIATNPTFGHGVTGGQMVSMQIDQALEERTSSARFAPNANRTGATPGFSFGTRLFSASAGLYLFGASGTKTVTGTSPYTHTITLGDDLPYLTIFGKLESTIWAVQDAKISDVELSWSENDPLEMQVSGMGTAIAWAPTFAATTDESRLAYMLPVGGTFQLSTTSATPAAARITAGSIKISNKLDAIFKSGTITPDDLWTGQQEVSVSLTVIPDDTLLWRSIVTGTTSGTSVNTTPPFGSFSVSFANGSDTLTVAATRVAFMTDFPEAKPSGGAIELQLEGLVTLPSSGSPLTVTLVNTTASY